MSFLNRTSSGTSAATPAANDPVAHAPFVDAAQFAVGVEQTRGLAVVDFTADHCPPCRMLAPHIDALARDLTGSVTVVKVNVEEQPGLASRFGVRGTPTVLFFRDGQVVDHMVGAVPLARLRSKVDELQQIGSPAR